MLTYKNTNVENLINKYADYGGEYLLNIAGSDKIIINAKIRNEAIHRLKHLFEVKKIVSYKNKLNRLEKKLVYCLVTKVLLHLTYF